MWFLSRWSFTCFACAIKQLTQFWVEDGGVWVRLHVLEWQVYIDFTFFKKYKYEEKNIYSTFGSTNCLFNIIFGGAVIFQFSTALIWVWYIIFRESSTHLKKKITYKETLQITMSYMLDTPVGQVSMFAFLRHSVCFKYIESKHSNNIVINQSQEISNFYHWFVGLNEKIVQKSVNLSILTFLWLQCTYCIDFWNIAKNEKWRF